MKKKRKQRTKRRQRGGGFTDFDEMIGDPHDAYADDGMYGYPI